MLDRYRFDLCFDRQFLEFAVPPGIVRLKSQDVIIAQLPIDVIEPLVEIARVVDREAACPALRDYSAN